MSDDVWQAVLNELQLQLTKPTFDAWVMDTQLLSCEDDGLFIIGVPNAFTRDWLENRLGQMVERTLVGILGCPCRVKFVVVEGAAEARHAGPDELVEISAAEEQQGGVVAVRFYSFDPMERGFLQMPKYCEFFWQPFLGATPYATYRFLRSLDRQNDGWGRWHFVTVERIAATVADGKRQAITGVQRERKDGSKYWRPGAFDRLEETSIARVERLGVGKNLSYRVSCLNSLPLLTPVQVQTLAPILQEQHAKFIRECDIEQREWEQLELPTLVRPAA